MSDFHRPGPIDPIAGTSHASTSSPRSPNTPDFSDGKSGRRKSRRKSRRLSGDSAPSPLEETKPSIEHTFVNHPNKKPERKPPSGTQLHDVSATDTLSGIAVKYKTTVTEIKKLNRSLRMASVLFPGQALVVPVAESSTKAEELPSRQRMVSPVMARLQNQPPLKRMASEEELSAVVDKPVVDTPDDDVPRRRKSSLEDVQQGAKLGAGGEADIDDIASETRRMSVTRLSSLNPNRSKDRLSKEFDNDIRSQVLGGGRPLRQIDSYNVIHCVENGHVRGRLVITEAMIVFEPRLDDYLVKKLGLLEFQMHLDIAEVVDFRVLGAEEEQGFREGQKKHMKGLAESSRGGGYYHIINEDVPHSILRLLYLENNSYENYSFFLVPEREAGEIIKKLENRVHHDSISRAEVAMDMFECKSEKTAAYKALGHDPHESLDEEDIVIVEKGDTDPLKDVSSYIPKMYGTSEFLSGSDVLHIRAVLPTRQRFAEWVLLYSVVRHGASMHSFYNRVSKHDHTVIVMQDKTGEVFGGYASAKWSPSDSYFGTGESFIFTFHDGFKHFGWTKKNNYFMLARNDSIAMGGGGGFGFRLDSEFHYGSTASCNTFGNCLLTKSDEFKCRQFEVWGLQGVTEDGSVVMPDDEFANWVEPGLINRR